MKFSFLQRKKCNPSQGSHTWLYCIVCKKKYSLFEKKVTYRCTNVSCGGLLNIEHNISELKKTSATQWRSLIQNRLGQSRLPFSSGVWSKKEWVLPHVKDEDIVSLGEGNSPLLEIPRLAKELNINSVWLKQCGTSHTGSFKDLGMTVLVSHVKSLIASGHPIRAIACASTGDTSAALGAYAAYANIPTVVLLPAGKISTAQLVQAIACGSLVLSLKTDFDGCMNIIQELVQDESIYMANSMNPLRLEGQKTMAIEIIQQLGWNIPDWFIIPGGNLGNVSALASGLYLLKDLNLISKLPRICVAQSVHANPLYLSYQNNFKTYQAVQAKKTLASAIQIGDPVSYPRAVKALQSLDGIVEQATEEELANMAARVDRYGMFNDPHTGVALACLQKLCIQDKIKKSSRVVVISTAHGLKFTHSKVDYHKDRLGFRPLYQNKPIEIEAKVRSVREALEKNL